MSLLPHRDIGAFLNVPVSTTPFLQTPATVNGAAIDRLLFGNPLSCKLMAQAGAATGGPSAQTYNVKLQDSADGTTGWVDFTDGAVPEISADDLSDFVDIDISAAKRFVRVVRVIALTGGTAWNVGESLILGGSEVVPV